GSDPSLSHHYGIVAPHRRGGSTAPPRADTNITGERPPRSPGSLETGVCAVPTRAEPHPPVRSPLRGRGPPRCPPVRVPTPAPDPAPLDPDVASGFTVATGSGGSRSGCARRRRSPPTNGSDRSMR